MALAAVHEPEAVLGTILDNRYRIVEQLGEGGMGTVYRAEHVLLGEPVAIKVLSPRFAYDREWVQRFLLEARAARRIQHPNIVRIVDVAVAGPGVVYMVMELLTGETLSQLLRREGPLPWQRALKIVDQVAAALAAAHACSIVHRDIKPSNCVVLADSPGDGDTIKVLDFGIAKFTDIHDGDYIPQTVAGVWMGTAEYMAPEMFRGEAAGAGLDIYALGVLLYKLLTGETPFRGTHLEVMAQQQQRTATPPSHKIPALPPAVDALVLRVLDRDLATRTPSMTALRADIADALRLPTSEPSAPAPVVRDLLPPLPDSDEPTASRPGVPVPLPDLDEPTSTRGAVLPAPVDETAPSTEQTPIESFITRHITALLGASLLLALVLVCTLVMTLSGRNKATPDEAPPVADTPAAAPPLVAPEPPPDPTPTPAPVVVEPTPPEDPAIADDPANKQPAPRPKKDPKPRPKKKGDELPELLTVPVLRGELAKLDATIQSKCFAINRAVSGTRVQMSVIVSAEGAALVKNETPKLAQYAGCIGYWVRSHTFPKSRTGGKIQHAFLAR